MADTTKPEAKELPVAGVVLEAVPQITAADVTSAVQTALAEERTRTSTIMTICQRANHPELANEYIAANMSVADVNAKLVEVLCKDRPPVGDAGGNDAPAEKEPNAAFKAEFAADRAVYQRAGISEEDYIRSRRIDAGEEPLVTR